MDYKLLDSGCGKKLEQFGPVVLVRPSSVAVWPQQHPKIWKNASAEYLRRGENGEWVFISKSLPQEWEIDLLNVRCTLKYTPFGHIGIFPEHTTFWPYLKQAITKVSGLCRVLNLFAYTGATSIFCAQLGATVCHVDASKAAVKWAQKNVSENTLKEKKIYWVIEDVFSFIKKEIRKNKKYDIILLDPPTFGRGTNGEIFKIDRDIFTLLQLCSQLLSESCTYLLITSHTPGHTPEFLRYLSLKAIPQLSTSLWSCGESFCGQGNDVLPSGVFAQWSL